MLFRVKKKSRYNFVIFIFISCLYFSVQSVAQVSGVGLAATDWLRGSDVEKFASQAAAVGPPQVHRVFIY